MFGSAALELAIALVLVFVVVSLLVTALTELLAAWLRWRAANLSKSLRGMLGSAVQEQVYAHPLVKTLLTPTTGPPIGLAWLFRLPGVRRLWPTAKGPSYIPSRTFAFALLDLMEQPYQALARLTDVIDAAAADPSHLPHVVAAVQALPVHPSMAGSLARFQPLVQELAEAGVSPQRARAILLRLRNEAVALGGHPALFDTGVQGALRPLLAAAGGNDERMRAEVETWFDGIMDRTAGWYKRKTQAVQVLLGFVLAVWLDVDIVLISRALWADSSLRSALVAQADVTASGPAPGGAQTLGDPEQRFEQLRGQILSLGLPVRGSCVAVDAAQARQRPWWCDQIDRQTWTVAAPYVGSIPIPTDPMRWLGWILTAVAASLGAPFWFDLLKKATSIRGSGPSPDQRARTAPEPVPLAADRTATTVPPTIS
jgi:hypothetical protein